MIAVYIVAGRYSAASQKIICHGVSRAAAKAAILATENVDADYVEQILNTSWPASLFSQFWLAATERSLRWINRQVTKQRSLDLVERLRGEQ